MGKFAGEGERMTYPKSERVTTSRNKLKEKNPNWLELRKKIFSKAQGENIKVFNPRHRATVINIRELPMLEKINYLESKFKLNGSKQVVTFALIKLYEEVKESEKLLESDVVE